MQEGHLGSVAPYPADLPCRPASVPWEIKNLPEGTTDQWCEWHSLLHVNACNANAIWYPLHLHVQELEFEDDDGTWYAWDAKLRKYMPKGGEEQQHPMAATAATLLPGIAEEGEGGEAAAAGTTAAAAAGAGGAYDWEAMTFQVGPGWVRAWLGGCRGGVAVRVGDLPPGRGWGVGGRGGGRLDALAH